MTALILARLQFAITTVYHFFFVPLTLGLSILVAIMETLYVRTGKETYQWMTKFWGKLFLINFTMGVVTGIVQEFQFGMNWSEYSRFVGDIFGAPLAIEALLAFFLESVFLGIWVFGWNKLSKGLHALTIWLVALGSSLSAMWILVANSFMQHPVGYQPRPEGGIVMTNFLALVANPHLWYQFPHVFAAGLTTAAFFVIGISAFQIFRKQEVDIFKTSFKMGIFAGIIGSVLVGLVGHAQGQYKITVQPMKIAVTEGMWETEDPASFKVIALFDEQNQRDVFSLRIPRALSLLIYNRLTGKVEGIKELQSRYEAEYGPGIYYPSLFIPFWTFRVMVGVGFLLVALALGGLYLVWKNRVERYPLALKIFSWAMVLPYLANTGGWILTEVGRYPWIVFGLIKVEQGVSPTVSPGMLLVSLIGYILIYGMLILVTIYLFRKQVLAGLSTIRSEAPGGYEDVPQAVSSKDQAAGY